VDSTLRFRAASRVSYARAVLGLARLARSGKDFTFGPVYLPALEDQGLVVSGPDLSWADDFLAQVPGLHRAAE
jgi:hypothetical protein